MLRATCYMLHATWYMLALRVVVVRAGVPLRVDSTGFRGLKSYSSWRAFRVASSSGHDKEQQQPAHARGLCGVVWADLAGVRERPLTRGPARPRIVTMFSLLYIQYDLIYSTM